MAKKSLYPPNPPDVPDDYTTPSPQYRTQTMTVLLALVLFFTLYFGLMLFCVLYGLWAVFLCPANPPALKLAAFLGIIPTGILFIYMFKNLFKFERAQKEFLIEIFEDEHPKLFEFIRTVCEDVGGVVPRACVRQFRRSTCQPPRRRSPRSFICSFRRAAASSSAWGSSTA